MPCYVAILDYILQDLDFRQPKDHFQVLKRHKDPLNKAPLLNIRECPKITGCLQVGSKPEDTARLAT